MNRAPINRPGDDDAPRDEAADEAFVVVDDRQDVATDGGPAVIDPAHPDQPSHAAGESLAYYRPMPTGVRRTSVTDLVTGVVIGLALLAGGAFATFIVVVIVAGSLHAVATDGVRASSAFMVLAIGSIAAVSAVACLRAAWNLLIVAPLRHARGDAGERHSR